MIFKSWFLKLTVVLFVSLCLVLMCIQTASELMNAGTIGFFVGLGLYFLLPVAVTGLVLLAFPKKDKYDK